LYDVFRKKTETRMSALLDISTPTQRKKKEVGLSCLPPVFFFYFFSNNARGGEIEEIPKEGRKSSEDDDDDDDTLRSIDRY